MNKQKTDRILNKIKISAAIKAKETINGIDFFTLPLSTNVCVNDNGYRFTILKPYKRKKARKKAVTWALEQFEKKTLKPFDLSKWM